MSCVNWPTYKFAVELDVAAGETKTVYVPLPRGGKVHRMSATSSVAIAASGTAANVMTVTLQDKTGAAKGTITNNSSTAETYVDPPVRSAAYAQHQPTVLDFEKRPGINYTLVRQGDRPEVRKCDDYNRAITFDIPQATATNPTLPDETNTARVVIAKGSSVAAGQVLVELWIREG